LFINRWVGAEYTPAYTLLLIFIVPILLALMQSPTGQVLYGISKHKFLAFVNIGEAMANLGLSLIFVRYYGLAGVALGTAIPLFIVKTCIHPIYVCKKLKLSKCKYYLMNIKAIIVSIGVLLPLALLFRDFIVSEYLNIILFSISFSVVFSVIVFFVGFDRNERGYLIEVAKRMI